MSSEILVYPRLPSSSARRLLVEQEGIDLGELRLSSELTHPDAAPSATGGVPAGTEKIREVRDRIRGIAEAAGFPAPLGNRAQQFDRPCGTSLLEMMDIVPADAAEEGVWAFLTLVVVPEIGPWRFGRANEERLLGRPRNVLRRTWWRAYALGPDLQWAPAGCEPLGEDESVQIMERPSLGGNRRTAHALQAALWRAESSGLSVGRSELMRELTRRSRALKSHLLFDAMSDEELAGLLDGIVAESTMFLQS